MPTRERAALARHSGGVKSAKRMLPAAISSRSYPIILRNASLASMISHQCVISTASRRIGPQRDAADCGWKRPFDDPIALPHGRQRATSKTPPVTSLSYRRPARELHTGHERGAAHPQRISGARPHNNECLPDRLVEVLERPDVLVAVDRLQAAQRLVLARAPY